MTSCATRDFFASHRLPSHPTSETVEPGVWGTEAGLLLVEHICSLVSGRSVASASVRSIPQAWESSRCEIEGVIRLSLRVRLRHSGCLCRNSSSAGHHCLTRIATPSPC
ncbi:unnamed protein product [Nippostrongylus brasiliensis]|uniref:Uncharacterized protein n=1 Tax=Nippostrongylus brasiliensis TaxID=27835 RepID=A0A0N4Y156_NIPBR|nr:unnamed protein product [Nippostrongylus brasiliensis]